jgi:hypothetical protein
MAEIVKTIMDNPLIILAALFALGAVALFIVNISMLAQNGVMADSYSDLKGQVSTIWSLGGVGVLLSFIAIWIYSYSADMTTPVFIALLMSSLAIFISYSSMATAVIVKK